MTEPAPCPHCGQMMTPEVQANANARIAAEVRQAVAEVEKRWRRREEP